VAQFKDDLGSMVGEIRNLRPGVGDPQIKTWINWRVRQALDVRTFWSDLLRFGILPFPDAHTDGTVSVASGSSTVTGTATGWPVSDIVNTTLSDAVEEIGYVRVTPAAMTGLAAGGILYVDAAGANPEIVPVVEVGSDYFMGKFAYTHAAGVTATQSSLANLQFRISTSYPVFTVRAVVSATSLRLDNAWGGAALADQTYSIHKMYATLADDLKGLIAMKDEQTGYPVRLHVPIEEANYLDPQRTMVSGNPWYGLVDLGANDQGQMLYEVWPAPTSARQFSYAYWKQWPEMEADTDRPPWFINPSVFVFGALADAYRYKSGPKDQYHNPELAEHYEGRFREGVEQAKNADEAKKLEALRQPWWNGQVRGNYDTWQLNDPAWAAFDFGGGIY
jgi:hypothetical protein